MMNGSRKSSTIIVLSIPLILFFFISQAHPINTRQSLEIIIGGEESPPPEPPVCPEPIPPPPPPPVCPEPVPPPPPPPEECPPPPPPPSPPPPPPSPSPPPPPPPPSPPPPSPPPPPPPKPTPKPPPPPSIPLPVALTPELRRAAKVIEAFRLTIGTDRLGVTNTWNGKLCIDKSKYRGFVCDTTVKENKLLVAIINFNNFEFKGKNGRPLSLNSILGGLSDIIVFHSNSNFFSGGVPAAISKIPSLFELDLSNNNLTGGFPQQVLSATQLTFLDLRFNFLTGPIPPAVFKLDLDVLFLNNNYFSGYIPQALGSTPSLYVTLANNKLTGPIPATIGAAADTLLEILLLGNTLSGCLPYQIGFLKKMTLFDASANMITGPIPHSMGCLKSLNYLNISYNQLYGTLPEGLCKIKGLEQVTLSNNYITQVGPACRSLIARKVLDVGMNCILDLPNQRTKATCANFFLHQQSCPDPQSMNKIPCKISESESESEAQVERKLMEKPRTYAALELHA